MDTYRVVIAEPDEATRLELQTILESAGHVIVAHAAEMAELLEALSSLRPEVALVSDSLPGKQYAGKPLADHTAGPILILRQADTAGEDAGEEPERLAANSGVFGTLLKPLRPEDVLTTVAVAVQRFRDLQECHDSLDKLQTRLADRMIIERAKGLLMKARGLTEEEAFKQIHFTARQENRRMRAVAEEVLASEETGVSLPSRER